MKVQYGQLKEIKTKEGSGLCMGVLKYFCEFYFQEFYQVLKVKTGRKKSPGTSCWGEKRKLSGNMPEHSVLLKACPQEK